MTSSVWPSIKDEVNGEQLKHAEGDGVALAFCPSMLMRETYNDLNKEDQLGVALDQV